MASVAYLKFEPCAKLILTWIINLKLLKHAAAWQLYIKTNYYFVINNIC
jgi:low affinity Fe/Cu permease